MWPFRKKETQSARLERECREACSIIAQKWLTFSQLQFKDGVPLSERILIFMEPAMDGVLTAKPSLAALQAEIVMLILANGIVEAGTHSALEVQDALGIPRA